MLGGRLILTLLIALGVVAAYATVMAVAVKLGNLIVARHWNVPFADAWVAMFSVALIGVFVNLIAGWIGAAAGAPIVGVVLFIAVMFAVQTVVLVRHLAFRPTHAALITAIAFGALIPLFLLIQPATP